MYTCSALHSCEFIDLYTSCTQLFVTQYSFCSRRASSVAFPHVNPFRCTRVTTNMAFACRNSPYFLNSWTFKFENFIYIMLVYAINYAFSCCFSFFFMLSFADVYAKRILLCISLNKSIAEI